MFKQIAVGSFGKVFAHEQFPNYVVRAGYAYEDTGYTQWIMDILDNRFSLRVPKIYMFTIKYGNTFTVLERLNELNTNQHNVAHYAWSAFLADARHEYDRLAKYLDKIQQYDPVFAHEYVNVFHRSNANGFSFDCSTHNIMSREDGTMIMTDPYFDSNLNINSFNYEIDCEFNEAVKHWMRTYD